MMRRYEVRSVGQRNTTRGGVTAALVVALSFGCGDSAETPAPLFEDVPAAERFGGTVVIAGAGEIETFNPAATTDELSQQVQRYAVLMTLLRPDEALRPRPYLAESWEINEDSTRVVFHLRDDIFWHDGEPTTAADVEFTFNAVKNPETGFPNAQWLEGWEGPELIDRYTIRFAVRPRANLMAGWTRLPVMPRHLMAGTGPTELATHRFGTEPVGNGPFRFAGRDAGGNVVLEANEDFPAELGGRPYVDRLVHRVIPEPQTQLAELRAGGAHYVRTLAPTQVARAADSEGISVAEIPSRAYGFIAWNGKRDLFQDPAMRRALTMAIDRSELIGAARNGLGLVANGPLGPWHPAHDADLAPPPFAPDSAARTFDSLGWSDTDGDGVRDRNGTPFAFSLTSTTRDTYTDIMTIVQAQLAQVGVRVDVESMEGSAFIDAITSPERRFDAFVLEWEPDLEVDDRQLFSCESIGQTFQFSSYCSQELEPILQSIPEARSPDESDGLLRRYVEIVNRDQPHTFLYFAVDAAARRDELRGMNLDIRGDLQGVREWWLHPDARGPAAAPDETH
ncbi:MAG: ABC transporter substrate-binding protein [Gemmatimonadota bacterium]|nr:ABC transporter substrate-binding protein [Gemmatimonadota bacterium]